MPLITSSNRPINSEVLQKQSLKNTHFDQPFIIIQSPDIILGALKPSEWMGSNGTELKSDQNWKWNRMIIVRLVEQSGHHITTQIQFNNQVPIQKIQEVNVLELHPSSELAFKNQSLDLTFTPFEIKTLRIQLK
jgi:hypothetical protein